MQCLEHACIVLEDPSKIHSTGMLQMEATLMLTNGSWGGTHIQVRSIDLMSRGPTGSPQELIVSLSIQLSRYT